jgi:hypothetical protein
MLKPGAASIASGRRPPNDPMVNPSDPVLALLRRLRAWWRRLTTDEEGP